MATPPTAAATPAGVDVNINMDMNTMLIEAIAAGDRVRVVAIEGNYLKVVKN